tara:strand:- start:6961 stop:8727 length:1767 start_codon:yes stop_codon:yes gene_type:complete
MRIWIVYILALLPLLSIGQTLELSVSKNPVAVGEEFRIDFTLNGEGESFNPPNLNGLRKISGPNQSSSSSMQIINGKISRSKTTTYSYYVTALKEGELTIKEASITSNGKIVRSKAGVMNVTKANPKAKTNSYNIAENVFVKTSVNKNNIYQGEQIVVSYKLYSKINLTDINISSIPELNGFWKEEVETKSTAKLEVIDGVRHNVWEISRFILTPQKSGKLNVDPMNINVTVQIKKQRNRRDPFGDPFGMFGSYQNIEEEIQSKNIKINVKDLPEGAPENFNGAVGQFELKSSVDKKTADANEAINYKLTLSGNGNIHLIDNIPVNFPANFESYDPQKKDKTFNTKNGIAGKIEFEHLLIPRYKGEYSIDGVSFSYFNPRSKTYKTITTESLVINVLKGENNENAYVTSEELKNSNSKGFISIKETTELSSIDKSSFNQWLFIALMLIPLLVVIIYLIFLFIEERKNRNPILRKYRKSLAFAQKRLKKAQIHLENDEKELFFEEIEKSLWSYFSNKFNVDIADLSKETINAFFDKNGVTETVKNNFMAIIEKCEFCRFAPSALETEDMKVVYEKATAVIIEVEQDLKK